MLFRGFKFGMLLQLAIGPVCIFIFQLATMHGFYMAETGVFGVVIIDGIFILAAILGVDSIIGKENIRFTLKIFGASIIFVFGLSMVLSLFNIKFLPSLSIFGTYSPNSSFLQAIILTAANPLTIFFWAGVFSTKIIEENMKRENIYVFGFGALFSTMFFLTLIAFVGRFTKTFFSPAAMQILNLVVGISLIYFSVKMILKK